MKIYGAEAKWHFTEKLLSPTKVSTNTYLNNTEKNHLAKKCTYHQPNKKKKKIDSELEHGIYLIFPFLWLIKHFGGVIPYHIISLFLH